MIINNPKDRTVTLYMGGDSMQNEMQGPEEGMDYDKEGLKSAAEDILQAVDSKDAGGLAMALQSFWSLCDKDEDEGEEGGMFLGGEVSQRKQSERLGEKY